MMMDEGVYREIVEACRPFYVYPHHAVGQLQQQSARGASHRLASSLLDVSLSNTGDENQRLTPDTDDAAAAKGDTVKV